ncbi:hypothetical protein QTG54_015217 [Skeletonema marinoi]|uniref:Uncharacterized protein n=1 Tax=Skeletonema marinoi TaxID=267567 RepID=A0AAD8XU55_9STRA|nr:hypothetical protein QTG54_015217 [Skeletonema marinoi]
MTTAITNAEETHGFDGYCSYCIIAISRSQRSHSNRQRGQRDAQGTLTTLPSDLLRIPDGYGVEKDKKKEVYHVEEAAIAGHPGARYTMSGKTKVSKDDFAAALRAHQAAVDATKSPQREAAEEVNATNSPQKNAVENNASHDDKHKVGVYLLPPDDKKEYSSLFPSPQQDDMTMEQHNICVFTSDDEESVSEFSPFFSSLPSSPKLSPPTFSNSNGNDRSSPGAFSLSNFDWDVNNNGNDLATAGAAPAVQHESESSTKNNDVLLFPSGGDPIPSSEDHNGASSCPGGMQPPLTVQRNVYPSFSKLPPVPVHHHYLAAANTTINNVDNNSGMMSSLQPSHPQANTTAALCNTAGTETAQLYAQLFQAQADYAAMQQQLSAFVADNSLSSIVEAVNLSSSVNSVASLLSSNNNTARGASFSFGNQQPQMQQLDHQVQSQMMQGGVSNQQLHCGLITSGVVESNNVVDPNIIHDHPTRLSIPSDEQLLDPSTTFFVRPVLKSSLPLRKTTQEDVDVEPKPMPLDRWDFVVCIASTFRETGGPTRRYLIRLERPISLNP